MKKLLKTFTAHQDTRFFLGVDSDTKNQAYSLVDLDGNPLSTWVIKSDGSEYNQVMSHIDHPNFLPYDNVYAVIEGQKVYQDKNKRNIKKSNPDSMIKLSRASGIAVYKCTMMGCIGAYIVQPSEWKGSVSKEAKQAQILRELGQTPVVKGSSGNKYCVPEENFLDLNFTEYKHAVDAIGIARWAAQLHKWNLKKEQLK